MDSGLIVAPAFGWVRTRPMPDDDESWTRLAQWRIERTEFLRELTRILGSMYHYTVGLLRPGLPPLVAYDRLGGALRWTLWAPTRSVLIDIYKRRMPPVEEMEDRSKFALEQGFRYGIVEPGKRLLLDDLREWVGEPVPEKGVTHGGE